MLTFLMSGPAQPAVKLHDALHDFGAKVQAGAPPESYEAYQGWLNKLGAYTEIAARAGVLPVWHSEQVKIIHPLFHVLENPPGTKQPFYFDIGDAAGLLNGLTQSFPQDSAEHIFSKTIAGGIVTLLEGQEPHPNPNELICLNRVNNGHYFNMACPGNYDEFYWTSAQEAVNIFNEIIADPICGDDFKFFAARCKANLTWRLDHSADPRCGINILDTNMPADGTARATGDYDGLYIPVYQHGLFAVIGQTADILEMNENSFALPIQGYNSEPHTTLKVFWGMQANMGQLMAHPILESQLRANPNAKVINTLAPAAPRALPLCGGNITAEP